MKNSSIQFIYFDVGGVMILDFSKTNKLDQMINDLGVPEEKVPKFKEILNKHEANVCRGEDADIRVKEIEEELGIKFPENYDMTQDFVNRFEKNPSILSLVDKLRNDFKLGLLTAQYPNMLNLITKRGLIPPTKWDIVIDSSVVGFTKPDPEIYDLAQQRACISPESILFVDNNSNLLEIPKQRGWKTFEYDPSCAEESSLKLEKFIYSN
jgi:FMN phosphatase YigB (HAD superfamily)